MVVSKFSVASIIVCGFLLTGFQVSAKDLGNGWTDQDIKKQYMGCIKGAVATTLQKLVKDGKITKQTSKEKRKAVIDQLIKVYSPVCKCIQSSIVKQVKKEDLAKLQKDKDFTRKISTACVKKHIK